MKRITKYETHAFSGYRFAVQRKGVVFYKYFSVKSLGSWAEALDKAEAFGAAFMEKLNTSKDAFSFMVNARNNYT